MAKRGYASGGVVKRRRFNSERATGRRVFRFVGARAMAPTASRGFYGAQSRLKRMMQGVMERKVVDTATATYACDTTGSVTLINGMAQGSDFTNRIGRKYTNVAVQLEGLINPQDLNAGPSKCRVMLIYDAQPNGVLPAITDVLTAATSTAFMNLNNRDRFKVLCDHQAVIGYVQDTATQAVSTGLGVDNVSLYKKINLETICDGTTAAIADVQTGSIFLLTIGNQPAANGANFVGACRIRFIDA